MPDQAGLDEEEMTEKFSRLSHQDLCYADDGDDHKPISAHEEEAEATENFSGWLHPDFCGAEDGSGWDLSTPEGDCVDGGRISGWSYRKEEMPGEEDGQTAFVRDFYRSGGRGYEHQQTLRSMLDQKDQMSVLSRSQLHDMMETCNIQLEEKDVQPQVSDMVDAIMQWRAEGGDFDEIEFIAAEYVDEFPLIPDDLNGVTKETLEYGFHRANLQLECLKRGIIYKGSDTKAKLVAKLMKHKEWLSTTCKNSFDLLAEQSK